MILLVADPGRPRLTWYGGEGERVELSGAVLQNWVNKTTNLLVEEFDAAPGMRVLLDLPVHWRAVLWALGAWRCGATVVLAPASETVDMDVDIHLDADADVDVVVTSRPEAWTGAGAQLVAVALPALARRFGGDLPPGAIDAAAAVMTYGDVVVWAPEPDPDEAAIDAPPSAPVAFAQLFGDGDGDRPRAVVDGDRPADVVLRELLDLWSADGSAVLAGPDATRELRADPTRLARLRDTERVTA